MTECRAVSASRPDPTARPSLGCVKETTQRLNREAKALELSTRDGTIGERRGAAQALLQEGSALLVELGDAPGSAQLATALRRIESALARMSPDEAARTIPSRPVSRQRRLEQTAQQAVSQGAFAMADSGNPEDFANAVVGNLSDRHLRALGRLSESDLRATLAAHRIHGNDADQAINRVKAKIAGKYQRVVRQNAQRELEATARRLERASHPGTPQYNALVAKLAGGDDELLRQLEAAGANVSSLRPIVENAGRQPGHVTLAQLEAQLPVALREAAQHVAEQAEKVANWDGGDLYDDAAASRAFPEIGQKVKNRWAMGGIVGESVNEHVSRARQNEAEFRHHFNVVLIAAAAVASAATGGALGFAIAVSGAATREGNVAIWAQQDADMTSASALAGVADTERAEEARRRANVQTATAAGAVVVDAAFAGAVGAAHHTLGGFVAGAAEAAGAVGIEHGKHAVEGAILHESH